MKHCGPVRSRLTLAVGARTPENLKIDLSSPSRSSLDSLLRRPVQPRSCLGTRKTTKDQLDFFKILFTWEEDRAKSLSESGKNYLTLIAAFFAFLGYKAGDTSFDPMIRYHYAGWPVGIIVYGLVVICLLLGLLLTLSSMSMHPYEQIADASEFFRTAVDDELEDDAFMDRMIVNICCATGVNSDVNERRARKLMGASAALFGGFLCYGLLFAVQTLVHLQGAAEATK
jgi:hypothetical protein